MPELPTTFGKYFLTEKLATGGMAEIYLAKIVGPGGFEKQLVIKQIHPRLSGQRHFVDLFVAEAKTLVTLAHGNIVPVYELGVVDDTYFIAMEYIDGPTLYRLTEALARRDDAMEPAVAAWIAARIVEGLDYAHRKGDGVIHRDLSPRNVMLSRDGEVKLVDFGIAVTLGSGSEGDSAHSAPTGSFPYMSPEQVRKEQLTGQTDLFSAGVLLWEMLVGRRLFARSDPDATLRAVVEAEIPAPSSQRPAVPARLDEIVMRALERDQAARWADAAEMLAALNKYLYGLDTTPGPRDVASLVARYCPPETRRLPTHADGGDTQRTPPPAAGPATAVIPRDARPLGKRRAPTRQESFATNVEFEGLLERGTPLLGVSALREPTPRAADPGPATTPAPRTEAATARSTEDVRDATTTRHPDAARSETPRPAPDPAGPEATLRLPPRIRPRPGREGDLAPAAAQRGAGPRSRGLLVVAGLGAVGLAIAAVVVFVRGRDAVLARDVAAPRDARALEVAVDAVPSTATAHVPVDAGPGASVDPTPAPDAAVRAATEVRTPRAVPRDAGAAPPRDAARRDVRPRADASTASSAPALATLKLGADPWGEIVIDGVKRGRTPKRVEVPAGRHVVEIIFAGEDPPRAQRFELDVAADEVKELVVDFTRP